MSLFPPEYLDARARYRAFMEEHVYPNEAAIGREDDDAQTLLEELRGRAREAGLWAPHVPPEAGGTGLGFLYYACLNEEIGRSAYAQLVFGCQAPDAGNAEILHLFGTDDQKERFLRPLVAGEVRSFFSMTEPEVAGSDPTLLRTRAARDGDEWVVDGHKWFSSGADGAAFAIVFAISDPDAEPHRRGTMILVPADTAGVEVVRPVPVMGHAGRGWSTHCEVRYTGVRVPVANTLGGEGDAFRLAQKRLGPGRIHHVMRWLGQMQRAFELMCRYANEREAFGGPLADKQTVQNWVADSAAEIQACRLLTMDAAQEDRRGLGGARRGVAPQVLRGQGALRRDRPGDPGARRARPHRRDAARRDVDDGPRRTDLRRPRRGAPHGRRPAHPAVVPRRRGLGVLVALCCACVVPPRVRPTAAAASRPSARRRLAARAAVGKRKSSGGRPGWTTHACPVSPDVSATHAASATSAGVSSGKPTDSSASRAVPATIAVSAKPGQTALIEMPRSESGGATLRTNPTTACLVSA